MELEAAHDSRAMADLAQLRSLCESADSDAFAPVSAEDVTDQRTPSFILQMNTIVQDSAQIATTQGILTLDGLRPQASWDRIGRYIKFNRGGDCGAWIGVHLGLWKKQGGTPLWLVFSHDEFSRAMEVRPLLEPWADAEGVRTSAESDHFAIGIDVRVEQEEDVVVQAVVGVLLNVAAILSELPPPASKAE